MCRFIETVRVENGQICNADCHLQRIHATCRYHWGSFFYFSWEEIEKHIDDSCELSKLRFVYSQQGIEEISCLPYQRPMVRSLQIVADNDIDYRFKSLNRSGLLRLKEQQKTGDDILIVKNNHITDTSFTNVALYDGDKWYTPTTPLLYGTCRARLLTESKIHERTITLSQLSNYSHLSLINAMNDLGDLVLPMELVSF